MKRIISLILVSAVLLLSVLSIVSCFGGGKKSVPDSDPELVVNALLYEEYEVDYEIAEDGKTLKNVGYDGVVAYIEAYYIDDDDGTVLDFITLVYFDSEDGDIEKAYDDLREDSEDIVKRLKIEEYEIDKSDNILWMGTVDAIDVAAEAAEYEGLELEKDEIDENATPNADPSRALNALKAEGYEANATHYDPAENGGLVCVVDALKISVSLDNLTSQTLPVEIIAITYYADTESANNAYQALQSEFPSIRADIINSYGNIDLRVGRAGNAIWYGTPAAINAAQ